MSGRESGEEQTEAAVRLTARALRGLGLTARQSATLGRFLSGHPVGTRRARLLELNRVLLLEALRGDGPARGDLLRH